MEYAKSNQSSGPLDSPNALESAQAYLDWGNHFITGAFSVLDSTLGQLGVRNYAYHLLITPTDGDAMKWSGAGHGAG